MSSALATLPLTLAAGITVMQSLDNFALNLETGDVLLFAGRGVTSTVIRWFTRSPWSHVGMVVRLPEVAEPLVLESTGLSESADWILGHPVMGVALVPLSRKIAEYPGDVAVRRREGPPLTPLQQRLMQRLVRRLLHRPYKNYLLCNLYDALSGFSGRRRRSGWFCSELVAECYRRLGWLPDTVCPHRFVPGHFGSRRLSLTAGRLLPAQWLKQLKSSAVPAADNAATDPRTVARETLLPRRSRGDASPTESAAA
ncbi:YiiX/YebB-like N1pC/P60 family cysteine hydrolase [Alloalcanivorax xenomutans]|uniref:YiiX/YebB-like N1pC/P60 family cysteine hydrolase n=1 Tax=Alloalcanivorax xenomutans TaxID=1094342 RepID=UPI0009B6AACB|nr:YiiX/YebB-like N1pC/P60 family cysteine hydrolase [Alloalcanivorax xenomutans]WOA32550.1 YiiX/YebB-like N1pC/P60 family cysteine hydrolase [Alloalcanivorax xenomutans]